MARDIEWTEHKRSIRALFEISGLLGWICEPDGYCVYLSPAWYAYTGQEARTGEGIGWLDAIHPEDRVATRKAFYDASDRQADYHVSYRLKKKGGGFGIVLANGAPHFDQQNRFSGMLGVTMTMSQIAEQAALMHEGRPAARRLTDREREVLELIARGHSASSAAATLSLAKGTVDAHVTNAMQKLGATNRTHAIVRALKLNELNLPDE